MIHYQNLGMVGTGSYSYKPFAARPRPVVPIGIDASDYPPGVVDKPQAPAAYRHFYPKYKFEDRVRFQGFDKLTVTERERAKLSKDLPAGIAQGLKNLFEIRQRIISGTTDRNTGLTAMTEQLKVLTRLIRTNIDILDGEAYDRWMAMMNQLTPMNAALQVIKDKDSLPKLEVKGEGQGQGIEEGKKEPDLESKEEGKEEEEDAVFAQDLIAKSKEGDLPGEHNGKWFVYQLTHYSDKSSFGIIRLKYIEVATGKVKTPEGTKESLDYVAPEYHFDDEGQLKVDYTVTPAVIKQLAQQGRLFVANNQEGRELWRKIF